MNRLSLSVLLIAFLLASTAGSVAAQQMYRWVDKDGKVHYTDTPPPKEATAVQQKRFTSGGSGDAQQLPYAVQIAVEKNPVSLFTSNCGESCTAARELLSKRGIPFTTRDPENNKADAEALQKLAGSLVVPVLQVGENTVKGWEAGQWNAALDQGGYPKTNPFTGGRAPAPKTGDAAKGPGPTPASGPAGPPPTPSATSTPPASPPPAPYK